jgi:hypothetical protein
MGRHRVGLRCSKGRARPRKSEAFDHHGAFRSETADNDRWWFLFGTVGTPMYQEDREGPAGPNSCTFPVAEEPRTPARTPDVDVRSRKPWERRLCRAAWWLRSVPFGDTAKKPGVFERHEVREMLAG